MPLARYTESPRYRRRRETCPASDLIDIDAGWIASGQGTVEEIGWELFHFYLDVASGRKKTWTEVHRIRDDLALFNPAPLT